jgi:hypothetical protein
MENRTVGVQKVSRGVSRRNKAGDTTNSKRGDWIMTIDEQISRLRIMVKNRTPGWNIGITGGAFTELFRRLDAAEAAAEAMATILREVEAAKEARQ